MINPPIFNWDLLISKIASIISYDTNSKTAALQQNGTEVLLNFIIMKFDPFGVLHKINWWKQSTMTILNLNLLFLVIWPIWRQHGRRQRVQVSESGNSGLKPWHCHFCVNLGEFCHLSLLQVSHLSNRDSILGNGCEN